MDRGGFYTHLKEAIQLNTKRSNYYASQTNGRTKPLSLYLVSMERLILPMALYYDKKAEKFNKRGIGIIKDDFVSMQEVLPMQNRPLKQAKLTKSAFKNLQVLIKEYLKKVRSYNNKSDFELVAQETLSFIEVLQKEESVLDAHFSMSIHILESTCFFAQNSVAYAVQSRGESSSLSRSFISFQLLGLGSALYLDRWAQSFHKEGVGIILNDMPTIL